MTAHCRERCDGQADLDFAVFDPVVTDYVSILSRHSCIQWAYILTTRGTLKMQSYMEIVLKSAVHKIIKWCYNRWS